MRMLGLRGVFYGLLVFFAVIAVGVGMDLIYGAPGGQLVARLPEAGTQ